MSDDSHLILQALRLMNGEGDPCDYGFSEKDIPAMIASSRELFPRKPYQVVSDWTWADVEVGKEESERFRQDGVKPAFIYANEIVEDEMNPFSVGHIVRTSVLVEFRENCLFVTRNRVYILVGPGRRMTVGPDIFCNLVF